MVDKDGDSLQDMQMYSPSHWSKESGLHSLGGTVFVYLFICLFRLEIVFAYFVSA